MQSPTPYHLKPSLSHFRHKRYEQCDVRDPSVFSLGKGYGGALTKTERLDSL